MTGVGDWDVLWDMGRTRVEVRWRWEARWRRSRVKKKPGLGGPEGEKSAFVGLVLYCKLVHQRRRASAAPCLLGGEGQGNESDCSSVDDSLKGQSDSTSKCNRAERLSGPSFSCSGWNSLVCLLFQIAVLKALSNAHQKCIRKIAVFAKLCSCKLGNTNITNL